MDAFKSSETAENQVYAAISTLEEKGILARFTAENGDDLYCLSQYTLNGMNKESIRKSKSYFLISVGNINFSAGMEIDKKTADNFYSNNRVLIQYLLMQKKLLAKSQYEKVIESIKWSKDRYQILFFEDGTFYPACLMDSVDTDVSAEYIITSRLGAEDVYKRQARAHSPGNSGAQGAVYPSLERPQLPAGNPGPPDRCSHHSWQKHQRDCRGRGCA